MAFVFLFRFFAWDKIISLKFSLHRFLLLRATTDTQTFICCMFVVVNFSLCWHHQNKRKKRGSVGFWVMSEGYISRQHRDHVLYKIIPVKRVCWLLLVSKWASPCRLYVLDLFRWLEDNRSVCFLPLAGASFVRWCVYAEGILHKTPETVTLQRVFAL